MSHLLPFCHASMLKVEQGSKVELLQEGDLRHRERTKHDIESPRHNRGTVRDINGGFKHQER